VGGSRGCGAAAERGRGPGQGNSSSSTVRPPPQLVPRYAGAGGDVPATRAGCRRGGNEPLESGPPPNLHEPGEISSSFSGGRLEGRSGPPSRGRLVGRPCTGCDGPRWVRRCWSAGADGRWLRRPSLGAAVLAVLGAAVLVRGSGRTVGAASREK